MRYASAQLRYWNPGDKNKGGGSCARRLVFKFDSDLPTVCRRCRSRRRSRRWSRNIDSKTFAYVQQQTKPGVIVTSASVFQHLRYSFLLEHALNRHGDVDRL